MLRLLSLIGLVVVVTGCAATREPVKPQYCHTSQTIVTQNGTSGPSVSSETTVECTDDQIKRLVPPKLGMATNCGEYTYWIRKGGNNVQRKGISCQKPDGSWEIVNLTQ